MLRVWGRLLHGLICISASAALAVEDFYVDSANPQPGDGSEVNPYNRLALIDWLLVSNKVAAGIPVTVNLKRGSTFREMLTVGASGSPEAPLTIRDYGPGDPPVISGDAVLTGWVEHASGPGRSWWIDWARAASYVWLDGVKAVRGRSADALNDLEWYSTGSRLYLRCDAGNPDVIGSEVTTSVRNTAVSITGRAFVRLEQIAFRHSSSYLVRVSDSDAVALRRCRLVRAGGHLDIGSATDASVLACTFEDAYGLPMISVTGTNTTATILFSHLHNAAHSSGIYVTGCRTLNLINCNIIGVRTRGVENTSAGVVNIRNCLVSGIGNAQDIIGYESVSSASGMCRAANSLILPNGRNPSMHLKGVVDGGGNVFRDPRFKRSRREGVFVIIEDDYPTLADWSVLARMAKNDYGYCTSLALHSTDRIHPEHKQLIQQLINEGHDIVSHTRSHADLRKPYAFNIHYVGSGTNCTMTISDSRLTTKVSGAATNDDLTLDLASAPLDTLEEVIPVIDRLGAYTCTYVTPYNHAVPNRLLRQVADVDILSAPHQAAYERGAFYTNELWLAKSDLETAYTNASGTPYQCKYLVYPGGYYTDEVIEHAMAAGYLGGRIDSPLGGSWHMENYDMYLAEVAAGVNGNMLNILFEDGANDYSPLQNSFSASNVVVTSPGFRGTYAGGFNGTNAFLTRPTNPSFDFSNGDWHLSLRLWPDRLQGSRTLFFTGSDARESFKVLVDGHGAVRLSLVSEGVETVSLATDNGAIRTNGWQKLSVQQLFDRWMVRVDDVLILDTRNQARLKAYRGPILIGCSRDSVGGENTDFYSGLMDAVVMSKGTYYSTQALADLMSECGGLMCSMSHGETGTPREVWRIVLDALKDYSGRFQVLTYTQASDYVRTHGVLQSDHRTVVRTDWGGPPDYNLKADSPCVGKAKNDFVEGFADLTDANGMPVTDSAGRIVVAGGRLSIGAFQPQLQVVSLQLPRSTMGVSYSSVLAAVGGVGIHRWRLVPETSTLPPGFTLSQTGVLSGLPSITGSFQFTVEVTDGMLQASRQVLSLDVQPQSVPPRIESVSLLSDASLELIVRGAPDGMYGAEASADLSGWVSVGSLVISNGIGFWRDVPSPSSSQRYYRVRF